MLRAPSRVAIAMVAGLAVLATTVDAHAQPQAAGGRAFETRCAVCHGADGHGGDTGPSIVFRLPLLSEADVAAVIRDGRPAEEMPPQPIPAADLQALTRPRDSGGRRR